MKKTFILLICIFLILVFIYFFKGSSNISDKHIYKDNINVFYPYFGNRDIGQYIDRYLNDVVESIDRDYSLYVDYDYGDMDNGYNVTFYRYYDNGNVISIKEDDFVIDTLGGRVYKDKEILVNNYIYDGYYQEFIDRDRPIIAFTFDDGPNYNTSRVIELFNRYNIKATFFLVGKNIDKNRDIVRNMDKYGMEIGNHTYSHSLLTNKSIDYIKKEISKCDNQIVGVIGKRPSLFRSSYGSVNNKIRSSVDRPIVIWDIDTLDWKYHNSKKIYNRVINTVSDGDIILMHDIYSSTYNALELLIPELLKRGNQIVTVSDLFYYKGISLKSGNVYGMAK